MPLITISGTPASGKSRRAQELKKYFEESGKVVHVVSENDIVPKAGFKKNDCYADSEKEKIMRADLKSEALRLLKKTNIVILDAGNYIKGYRYELFCATKAARNTQCVLFCAIQKERAWEFNQQRSDPDQVVMRNENTSNSNVPYSREIFDALNMRFEEPHGNHRWDKPLFVTFPEDQLNFEDINSALFELKPPPPNLSTLNPPLSSPNYLFELDRITQQIIAEILSSRKIGLTGAIFIKEYSCEVKVPPNVNAIQLNRIRRQFLNYCKLHPAASTLEKAPNLFVQFLNGNCNLNNN